jgi:hypothetical protein
MYIFILGGKPGLVSVLLHYMHVLWNCYVFSAFF